MNPANQQQPAGPQQGQPQQGQQPAAVIQQQQGVNQPVQQPAMNQQPGINQPVQQPMVNLQPANNDAVPQPAIHQQAALYVHGPQQDLPPFFAFNQPGRFVDNNIRSYTCPPDQPRANLTDDERKDRESLLSDSQLRHLRTMRSVVKDCNIGHDPLKFAYPIKEIDALEKAIVNDPLAKALSDELANLNKKHSSQQETFQDIQARLLLANEQRQNYPAFWDSYKNAKDYSDALQKQFETNKVSFVKDLQDKYVSMIEHHQVSPDDAMHLTHTIFPNSDFSIYLYAHMVLDSSITKSTRLTYHNWYMARARGEDFCKMKGTNIKSMPLPLLANITKMQIINDGILASGNTLVGSGEEQSSARKYFAAAYTSKIRIPASIAHMFPTQSEMLVGGEYVVPVKDGAVNLTPVETYVTNIQGEVDQLRQNCARMYEDLQKLSGDFTTLSSSAYHVPRPNYHAPNSYANYQPNRSSYKRGGRGDARGRGGRGGRGLHKLAARGEVEEIDYDEGETGPTQPKRASGRGSGPRLKGGDFATALASDDIDGVLKQCKVSMMSAEFARDIRLCPEDTRKQFKACKGRPMIIPFWTLHHWIAVVLMENGRLWIADSAPSDAVLPDIQELIGNIEVLSGKAVDPMLIEVPKQPRGSGECGVHLIVNALALASGCLLPSQGVLSYKKLRPLLMGVAAGRVPFQAILQAARVTAFVNGIKVFTTIPNAEVLSLVDFFKNGDAPVHVCARDPTGNAGLQVAECTFVKKSRQHWQAADGLIVPSNTHKYLAIIDTETFNNILPDGLALEPENQSEAPGVITKVPKGRKQATAKKQTPAPAPPTAPMPLMPAQRPAPRPTPATVVLPNSISEPCHEDSHVDEVEFQYGDLLAKNVIPPEQVCRWPGENLTAQQCIDLIKGEEMPTPAAFNKHLALSTQKTHRRILRHIVEHLERSSRPLDVALIEMVTKMAVNRNWAPTTTMTRLTSMQGALASAFCYRHRQVSILLKMCPRWLNTIRSVNVSVQAFTPNQPLALTEKQLKEAIQLEPRPEVKAAVEIAWLSAGRGGDVCRLLAKDIKEMDKDLMTVFYRQGKTASKKSYSVGVPLPSAETLTYLKATDLSTWAFPGVMGKDITTALRRVNPKLEQRSLRRGRLQYLSSVMGLSDIQLMEISRHASVHMLRRYLDFGLVSATTRVSAALAAGTVASSSVQPTTHPPPRTSRRPSPL